jgi:hypothetical protein
LSTASSGSVKNAEAARHDVIYLRYRDVPMYVTLEEFTATVQRLESLLEKGHTHLLVTAGTTRPPAYFDLLAGDPESAALLGGDDNRRALNDVTDAISAIVYGTDEERFVEVRSTKEHEDDDDVEDEEIARAKYALVRTTFPVEAMSRRFAVKRSAKTRTLAYFDWEVVARLTEDDGDIETKGQTYALLRLTGEGRRFDENRRDLVLTLDREDVDALLSSLLRLQELMTTPPSP